MKSVNKVILIGNLGKDPEVKYTPQGTPVAKITLATNERFKGKDGQWQERTEWHNVALFGRLGEIAAEYLRKGSQVYIEGRLRTRKWQDKEGRDRYTTEIVANEMQMLGGRGGERGGGAGGGVGGASDSGPRAEHAEAAAGGAGAQRDEFDDDIPF